MDSTVRRERSRLMDSNLIDVNWKALEAQSPLSIETLKKYAQPLYWLAGRLVSWDKAREITIQAFKEVRELPPVADIVHCGLLSSVVELAKKSLARGEPGAEILDVSSELEDALQKLSFRHRVAFLAPQ